MPDLSTNYLGMTLQNPLVVSPSPLCDDLDNIRRMEDAGAGAVVLHSLFEEQLTAESQILNENLVQGTEMFAEALSYFPDMSEYRMGAENYVEHVRRAKEAVDIPIIGSINGISDGGWVEYSKQIEEAGADALELNVYFVPTDPEMTGVHVREMVENLVRAVKKEVSIPVAVKIAHYFSAIPYVAKRLEEAGAEALVLFNRFYQPDFDLDNLEVVSDLNLSSPNELRLRLRWVAILYGRIDADMAITGGVHSHEDVLKSMMAGAKAAMMTSALLKYGIGHLGTVRENLVRWMNEHEYASIEMMQGSMSQKSVDNPAAFERAQYLKILTSYSPGW